MQADVDSCPSGVGGPGALIERQGIVPIAQQDDCEALALEFMPEQAGESERNRFSSRPSVKAAPTLGSSVGGIDDGKYALRGGRWRRHSARRLILRRIRSAAGIRSGPETAAVPAAGVPDEIAATVIVRPLLLKLAIRGTLAGNGQIGGAVASENVAWVMAVLSKVREHAPEARQVRGEHHPKFSGFRGDGRFPER